MNVEAENVEWRSNLLYLRIDPAVQERPRVWNRSAREIIGDRATDFDHSLSEEGYEKLFTPKGWADALQKLVSSWKGFLPTIARKSHSD